LENLSQTEEGFINLENLDFTIFREKSEFSLPSYDQYAKHLLKEYKTPDIKFIKSNMTKSEYLDKLVTVKSHIINGDIYQANLTRKFYGEFAKPIDPLAIFAKLNDLSPAPYASFIKSGEYYIISSSPELFIELDEAGRVMTCPIKGSSSSGDENKLKLSESFKDKAENLMITDLMRNDLSRSCVTGSVKTEDLFATEGFKTINHMYSKIVGQLKKDQNILTLLKNIFPPGSMTGAPKIMAMEICNELEKNRRGVYSGCIGYIAPNGSAKLSVVIRTLIIKGNKFEFQVGGGIVYDSDPELEWQETMTKASAIANTLGVKDQIEIL
jgi:para-aminobenzoate synthetase component 1